MSALVWGLVVFAGWTVACVATFLFLSVAKREPPPSDFSQWERSLSGTDLTGPSSTSGGRAS